MANEGRSDTEEAEVTGSTPPRRRNRRGQGDLLKGELIAAATRLLESAAAESEVSIRAVTREAGVAPQAFYLHFASLSELLFTVYRATYEQLEQALRSAAGPLGASDARLRALAQAYCDFALAHPGTYRVLTTVRGQPHPEWAEQKLPGMAAFSLMHECVAAVLADRGRADDTFAATVHLWASLHGLVSLRLDRPSFPWPPMDELVARTVERL